MVGLQDEYGCSTLHLAVQNKCTSLVQSLLLAGANINVPEGCGVTPIMIAINNNQLEMVKILIEYGARITGTFQGIMPTPLQMAHEIGNECILQNLKD